MRVTSDVWILPALTGSAITIWLFPGLQENNWIVFSAGMAAMLGLLFAGLYLIPWADRPLRTQPLTELPLIRKALMQRTAPALALSGLLCGIWWGIFNVQSVVEWQIPKNDWRTPVEVTLIVEDIVAQDPHRIRIDGRLTKFPSDWSTTFPQAAVKARLHWYGYEGIIPEPGETWALTARLRPSSGLLNQAGFNYQVFLLRKNIRVTGSVSAEARVSEPWLSSPRQRLFDFYNKNRDQLPFADLMLALSIGERQWMSDERWRILQQTGVAHLMAISGLHLTFVFGVAFLVLKFLLVLVTNSLHITGEHKSNQLNLIPVALLLSLLVAFLYAALAGFAVATLRALLLISVFVISRLKSLYLPPLRIFLRAVALVVFLDPFAWLDPGFWLSAGAVLAIFCWQWRLPGPAPRARFYKVRQLWRLEVMLTLMLLPLSLQFFQGISLIAPITNMLVVPVFSILVLPLCLIVVVLVFIGGVPAMPWAYKLAEQIMHFNNQLLSWIWEFLLWCSQLSYAWIAGYQKSAGIALVALICLWLIPVPLKARLMLQTALCTSIALVVLNRPSVEFAVHVLDVGQGSAIVVEQNGYALLFDAGPAYPGGFNTGTSTVLPFLRYKKLVPEYMVLSHPHRDHTGGADTLRSAFPSMQVFSEYPDELQCEWGQQWLWRNVRIKALAPMPGPSFGPNNDSCVLQLTYPARLEETGSGAAGKTVKLMLTGDIQQLTELRMVGRYGGGFESDVLMVPHHGSSTSSQDEFLDRVQPQIAVASRGYLNQFSMPRDDVQLRYQQRDIQVYDTALHGQVSLIYSGQEFRVKTYRQTIAPWWFNQQQRDANW